MNRWRHNNDVIIKKILCVFKIKFPTKCIFRIFPILRINGMVPFCDLFIERPSYIRGWSAFSLVLWVFCCVQSANMCQSFVLLDVNSLLRRLLQSVLADTYCVMLWSCRNNCWRLSVIICSLFVMVTICDSVVTRNPDCYYSIVADKLLICFYWF